MQHDDYGYYEVKYAYFNMQQDLQDTYVAVIPYNAK